MTFHLSGRIKVPLDDLERVRRALPEHLRLTLAEAGCEAFIVEEREGGIFEVSEAFRDRA